ncbi:MAG TPA: phosphoribosylanthranilate isomerase [Pseudorhodoplanes sp.]|jgi:phosphoribosylanthranilate isomerase|nr:phosphoribosylanthranilate isomerase [Pseudorhodoplanes sp.]
MSLLVKVCGLKTPEALDAALDGGADFVGFVFFPPSPRNVVFEAASALGARVRGRAKKVALTVDADDGVFENIVATLKPDMLQLHGSETPARVIDLKRRYGLPVMKALPVETRADLAAVEKYAPVSNWLLFDARPPREATRPGGLGKPFDWTLLRDLDPGLLYMLSGGLDADNVAEALRMTRAPAVDVSSGVERSPGEKDPEKIRAFIRAARKADNAAPARVASGA